MIPRNKDRRCRRDNEEFLGWTNQISIDQSLKGTSTINPGKVFPLNAKNFSRARCNHQNSGVLEYSGPRPAECPTFLSLKTARAGRFSPDIHAGIFTQFVFKTGCDVDAASPSVNSSHRAKKPVGFAIPTCLPPVFIIDQ